MVATLIVYRSNNSNECLPHLELLENQSKKLRQEVNEFPRVTKVGNNFLKIIFTLCIIIQDGCDMDRYMERACTFAAAVQIRKLYTANIKHCECTCIA